MMVGRPLEALFAKRARRSRRQGGLPRRRASRWTASFSRRLLLAPRRRDRRHGRAGRRGPLGDRAGLLRHDAADRAAASSSNGERVVPRTPEQMLKARARLPAGGPRRPGPDHVRERSSTTSRCRSSARSPGSASSMPGAERRVAERGGRHLRRASHRDRPDRLAAVRRQPAEGRLRQVAGHRSRRVLILDEPTHGIDVGSKAQVHRIIAELAELRAWRS